MEIKVRTLVKYFTILVIIALLLVVSYFIYEKFQEISRVKKVKAAYSMLSETYKETVAVENFKWTKKTMDTNIFAKGFLKHLEIEEDCGLDPSKTCFAKNLHYLRALGDTSWSPMQGFYKVKLANGMNVAFKVLSPDCSYVRGRCATVFIDINGLKGPNQLGKDVFDFAIYKTELKPYEAEIVHIEFCLEGNGLGCADYILRYGNMNYKKFQKYYEKELRQQQIEAGKVKK